MIKILTLVTPLITLLIAAYHDKKKKTWGTPLGLSDWKCARQQG